MDAKADGRETPHTLELYREFMETRRPNVIANIALCLIHQTNYLLDQQLKRLEKDFLEQGGLRERMFKARLAQRSQAKSASAPALLISVQKAPRQTYRIFSQPSTHTS